MTLLLLAFEQESTVGAAISGALGQTYENLEIGISDDASTDGTFAAMQAAVAGYIGPHRLILNRNPVNLGIGAHLNRMVGLSRGELLFVAAGDDVSMPQRCSRVVEAWIAAARCPDLIATALIDMDEQGALHARISPTDLFSYRNAADWLACPPYVVGAAQAWTRRLYDRFGPLPDAAMAEDMLMVFRAILSGGAITLAEPLVQYRRGGISRRRRNLHARDVAQRLLKNNRHALVELPQLLLDARLAGQLEAVESALLRRLEREVYLRDVFAARSLQVQWQAFVTARRVPIATRLRLWMYATWPGLLAPFFALKRWFARSV